MSAVTIISALTILISAHSILFSVSTGWYLTEASRIRSGRARRAKPGWLRYSDFWIELPDRWRARR